MTMLNPDLQRFRSELRAAIDADVRGRTSRRRVTRRTATMAIPGALVAVAISLILVMSGGPGANPADAAILTAAQSALTPPPDTIIHNAAVVTVGTQSPQPYELWAEASAPYAYRVIKFGHEAAWNGTTYSDYDAASNTVTVGGGGAPNHLPNDIVATLRSLIHSGQARVTGTTVVNGVSAYALNVSNLPAGWVSGVANGTYDVAQNDYRPLLIHATVDCRSGPCPETVQFQTYEYLPATPANESLVDLTAQHPGATVVQSPGGPGGSTNSGSKQG